MNLPNWITISRIFVIPVFVIFMLKYKQVSLEHYRYMAVVVFLFAMLSDAIDGAIARVRNQKTVLGSLLDPLADKLLLIASVVLLSLPIAGLQRLPIWIPVTFISRDIILILGFTVSFMYGRELEIQPNLVGKLTTLFQMLTVIWILLAIPHSNYIWRTAGTLTVVSGFFYVYKESKRFTHLEGIRKT